MSVMKRLVRSVSVACFAAALTHCAAADDPEAQSSSGDEASEDVDSDKVRGGGAVYYNLLLLNYVPALASGYRYHKAYIGGSQNARIAVPGEEDQFERDFLYSESTGSTVAPLQAANTSIVIRTPRGERKYLNSVCDGQMRYHEYTTTETGRSVDVELRYQCEAMDRCKASMLCAAQLQVNAAFCASSAR